MVGIEKERNNGLSLISIYMGGILEEMYVL